MNSTKRDPLDLLAIQRRALTTAEVIGRPAAVGEKPIVEASIGSELCQLLSVDVPYLISRVRALEAEKEAQNLSKSEVAVLQIVGERPAVPFTERLRPIASALVEKGYLAEKPDASGALELTSRGAMALSLRAAK